MQLDDENRRAVLVAEGLGHAFMALSDQASVMYLCSTPYAPGREHGVHPLDPDSGIAWPADMVSEKDAAAPSLTQAQRAGLLPDYYTPAWPVPRPRGAASAAGAGGETGAGDEARAYGEAGAATEGRSPPPVGEASAG